jgi:PKD repeat protein
VPLQVQFDGTHSYSTDGAITKYEWDWDGDGTFDEDSGSDGTVSHQFDNAGVYNATLRVTDANSATAQKIMLVLATSDSSFPPDDSVFALPSQSTCAAGEAVGFEIYCKGSANPLQYITGLRMTMPSGNAYVANTFDTGVFGGASGQSIDGLWAQMMPGSGFLLPPDNFIQIVDIGGGQEAIDLAVTPLSGSDLSAATGALCNFELNINSDSTFGFQRFDQVSRTYYFDGNQSPEFYWANENVPGLPGVDVQ